MMNNIKKLILLFTSLCVLSAYTHSAAQVKLNKSDNTAKPNIVFIAIDDMNDWVGYMNRII